MKDNKVGKTINSVFFTVIAIMFSIGMTLIIMSMSSINKTEKKYSTLEEASKASAFEVLYPNFMANETDLDIRSLMGQILTVKNNRFEFAASPYIADNADPLGGYDEYKEDKKFNVKETTKTVDVTNENEIITNSINFKYFRYKSTDNYSMINYRINDTMYSIKFIEPLEMQSTLDLIGLDSKLLTEYTEENDINNLDNSEKTYENGEKCREIDLDEQNIKFSIIDNESIKQEEITNEAIYFIIDDKVMLIVAYNNPNKYIEESDSSIEKYEFNGVYFLYRKENPFETDDSNYENCETFVNNIDNLLKSIDTIR